MIVRLSPLPVAGHQGRRPGRGRGGRHRRRRNVRDSDATLPWDRRRFRGRDCGLAAGRGAQHRYLEPGDVDADGDLDLMLADWGTGSPMANAGGQTRLWRNDGGRFVDATDEAMPDALVSFSWELELLDVDDDWDLDAAISCKRCEGSFLFRTTARAGSRTSAQDGCRSSRTTTSSSRWTSTATAIWTSRRSTTACHSASTCSAMTGGPSRTRLPSGGLLPPIPAMTTTSSSTSTSTRTATPTFS